jgi:hypothetical protein
MTTKREQQERDRRTELLFKGLTPKFYKGRHAKTCQCFICAQAALDLYKARAKLAIQGGARPSRATQTIPVKAHWREGRNHLKHSPGLRALVEEIVREILERKAH